MHEFRFYDNMHVRKLIALYTVNEYSAEREMSASACTRSYGWFVGLLVSRQDNSCFHGIWETC